MIRRKFICSICLASIVLFLVQCKKKKEDTIPETPFDRAGMLANIGENVIIPAYADLKVSVDSLQYFTNLFVAAPSLTDLSNLQLWFLKAYSRFQWVSAFEFGPAESELIRVNFNIFPCDTLQINSKIAAGDYNLSTAADVDAKGFPAVDFLLYGSTQNNNSVVAKFTTDSNAANAKTYLTTLVNELKSKTDIVNTAWSASGGNYISTFKSSTGTSVGSPIGMLVNQLNYDLELLKNPEIGIPLGKKTLGTPLPEKVQAFYSTKSLTLAMEHLKSIENIYLGRSALGVDGLGLDDYIVHLKAQHPSGPLNDVIKNKFSAAKTKLAAVPETLSQSIMLNPTTVDQAYLELQQLSVLLKTDMTSAMGVLITYQDNDGD